MEKVISKKALLIAEARQVGKSTIKKISPKEVHLKSDLIRSNNENG